MQQVNSATTDTAIEKCVEALHALRPHIIPATFVQLIRDMQNNGYHLIYIEENGKAVAAAGYRFTEHLAWGKAIYIDDLTTLPAHRKKGYSRQLLDYICDVAKTNHCDQVHLDSGANSQRYDAHRMYLRYGFNITSHHFALELEKY